MQLKRTLENWSNCEIMESTKRGSQLKVVGMECGLLKTLFLKIFMQVQGLKYGTGIGSKKLWSKNAQKDGILLEMTGHLG